MDIQKQRPMFPTKPTHILQLRHWAALIKIQMGAVFINPRKGPLTLAGGVGCGTWLFLSNQKKEQKRRKKSYPRPLCAPLSTKMYPIGKISQFIKLQMVQYWLQMTIVLCQFKILRSKTKHRTCPPGVPPPAPSQEAPAAQLLQMSRLARACVVQAVVEPGLLLHR